jgi:CheY-like chemotaxis protein
VISITDQGPGIPEKDLSRVFNPFFTTKDAGTGLGLAAAYAIVLNHDGFIEAQSPPGEGATFRIYIPASAKSSAAEVLREDIIKGVGKILVIDDEEAVRKVIGDMLLHLGYVVSLTREGHEAIEDYRQAREQGEPFKLIIMDLTIQGGLGGRETIRQLLHIDPSIKAIVSSGYSNDPVMANFRDYGFVGIVRKPYSVEKLSRAVHEAIRVN